MKGTGKERESEREKKEKNKINNDKANRFSYKVD